MKLKVFVAATGLAAVAVAAYSIHSRITPKPLRSFLVTSVMTSPESGKPYLKTFTRANAVRPDGSWVLVTYLPNLSKGDAYIRDIWDVTSGVHTTVDDLTQSIQTRAMTSHDIRAKRLSAATSCNGKPAGQILGFDVEYTEEKSCVKDPSGNAECIVKRWLAPDLGCFVLRKETTWVRSSDGLLLVDTKIQPVSVTFQPVDQFFDVPSYPKRTPGETLRELSRLYPDRFPMPESTNDVDKSYQMAHDRLK
jgi:hypothetical protein